MRAVTFSISSDDIVLEMKNVGISTLLDLHQQVIDQGIRYDFKDAHQLLSDFFEDIDKALEADKEI